MFTASQNKSCPNSYCYKTKPCTGKIHSGAFNVHRTTISDFFCLTGQFLPELLQVGMGYIKLNFWEVLDQNFAHAIFF